MKNSTSQSSWAGECYDASVTAVRVLCNLIMLTAVQATVAGNEYAHQFHNGDQLHPSLSVVLKVLTAASSRLQSTSMPFIMFSSESFSW